MINASRAESARDATAAIVLLDLCAVLYAESVLRLRGKVLLVLMLLAFAGGVLVARIAAFVVRHTADSLWSDAKRPWGQALRWEKYWQRERARRPGPRTEAKLAEASAPFAQLQAENMALAKLCMD